MHNMKKNITKVIRQYAELVKDSKPHLNYKTLKSVYRQSSEESRNKFIIEVKQVILKSKAERQKNISE